GGFGHGERVVVDDSRPKGASGPTRYYDAAEPPQHRMKVLVGTASWSDKSLVASKKFYPKEASTPEARLRFYATRFPLVEDDTSYYAIPLAQTAQAWAERTPGHFAFNMKAFRLFTGHATSPRVLPPDLRAELPELKKANFYWRDVPPELRRALWDRFKE